MGKYFVRFVSVLCLCLIFFSSPHSSLAGETHQLNAATSYKPMAIEVPEIAEVSGIPAVGQVLKAPTAGWPQGTTFKFQWLADGEQILGATKSTYKIRAADIGRYISVSVIGTKRGYGSDEVISSPTDLIHARTFSQIPKFKIRGSLGIEKTLSASTSGIKPLPDSISYQWFLNGVPIAYATGETYTTSPADAGGTVSVKITTYYQDFAEVSQTIVLKSKWPVGKLTEIWPATQICGLSSFPLGEGRCIEDTDWDTDLPTGWVSYELAPPWAEDPSNIYSLYANATITLRHSPISWVASFTAPKGAAVYNGRFKFLSFDPNDSSGLTVDAKTTFYPSRKAFARVTKASKIHNDLDLNFRIYSTDYSDDTEIIMWFKSLKVTYSYYK